MISTSGHLISNFPEVRFHRTRIFNYNALYSKKETLQNTYKSAEKEINALNRKLDNLKQYLDRDSQDHQTSDRKAERNQNTL